MHKTKVAFTSVSIFLRILKFDNYSFGPIKTYKTVINFTSLTTLLGVLLRSFSVIKGGFKYEISTESGISQEICDFFSDVLEGAIICFYVKTIGFMFERKVDGTSQ